MAKRQEAQELIRQLQQSKEKLESKTGQSSTYTYECIVSENLKVAKINEVLIFLLSV